MATLRLYDSSRSGNCYKVRLLLTLLGIPFERIDVDVVDRSNRLDLLGDKNPALRVPTLQLDDGTYLAESNAILWYFADGTPYLPNDRLERARVLQWMFFEQYDVEPNLAVARFWISILGKRDEYAGALEDKWKAGYRALDGMERHLDGRLFLAGDRFSIADIALYAYVHVADEGGFDLGPYPSVRAWLARVAGQPGHVPMQG
ncbi:MAG TPA: glutathione S-transferase family protein [Gemmatimonadota bacterium]|nr:glutathione S-transferase family protein [Gemmatimonadota bacterium]